MQSHDDALTRITFTRLGVGTVDAVYELLVQCGRHMASHGFSNWDPPPVTIEQLHAEAPEKAVLGAWDADRLVGTVTVGRDPTFPYDDDVRAGRITWAPATAPVVYVNRLAVHPDWQRAGLGARLMQEAEATAKRDEIEAVRLEVIANNPALIGWYERRGYVQRGRRTRPPRELVVLEKVLVRDPRR